MQSISPMKKHPKVAFSLLVLLANLKIAKFDLFGSNLLFES